MSKMFQDLNNHLLFFNISLLIFQLHHKYCGHFKIARKASLKFDSGEVCWQCMLHKVNLAKVMENATG